MLRTLTLKRRSNSSIVTSRPDLLGYDQPALWTTTEGGRPYLSMQVLSYSQSERSIIIRGRGNYRVYPCLLLRDVCLDLVGEMLRTAFNRSVNSLQVHADDQCAFTQECLEDASSKALAGPGDEGNLSFEAAGHYAEEEAMSIQGMKDGVELDTLLSIPIDIYL
jgi:hypothetical protein